MLDKEERCEYRSDDVKIDIDAVLGNRLLILHLVMLISTASLMKRQMTTIMIYGVENIPKINGVTDTITGGDFAYGPNTDTYYYHILGGRGGTCAEFTVGKIA